MAKTNFTLGRDFGALLVEIAREKIYVNFSPEAGVGVIKDSLMGEDIPDDFIYKLLRGDIILDCEDGHTLISKDYDPSIHNSFYKINVGSWLYAIGNKFYIENNLSDRDSFLKSNEVGNISYSYQWVLDHLCQSEEDLKGYKNISQFAKLELTLSPDAFAEILQKLDEHGVEVTIKYLRTLCLFNEPKITDYVAESDSEERYYSGNNILTINKTTKTVCIYKVLALGYIPDK